MTDRVVINRLQTKVPGLDEVLSGGIPEFSFNLVAGGPGCGKTTLMHQLIFANATVERPVIYFTILGEPPLKMLRYQQQFTFFDSAKLDGRIRFVHLGQQLLEGGLEKVLAAIIEEVDRSSPKIVVVDSFRSAVRDAPSNPAADSSLPQFVQRLALHLTSAEATTFLVGEYLEHESSSNPLFTIADGIFWLYQTVTRNSVVRRLQIMKLRGQREVPGLHTFKIAENGLQVFPRMPQPAQPSLARPTAPAVRLRTGTAGLDEMLGGGLPSGYSMMIVGPSGSGKTVLSTQFVLEGIGAGEHGVIAVFEKRPEEYLRTAPKGRSLEELVEDGKLSFLYIRPLDLSLDETMHAIREEVRRIKAKRVVLDSLSGLELALAPPFREDFRESLYRLVGAITAMGVTVIMTAEISDSYTELRLSSHGLSFLTDAIVLQRYAEMEGKLRKVLAVVKLRGHAHSEELRHYEVTPQGVVVGAPVTDFSGILVGNAVRRPAP